MTETGHARNIGHFATMISFVAGYDGVYQPTNAAITLTALQAKLTAAEGVIDGVTTALAPWKTKVNDRENAFTGIRPLTTRIINSYAASGAEPNSIKDARSFNRKIHGARAKALPNDEPEDTRRNSVSQVSYTQLVEHFDNLIELLSNDPLYNPNETDLQIRQLQAKSAAMKTANQAVITAATPLSNARLVRNDELYGRTSGLVNLAGLVKKYVKSVFGADSPQYRQISGLEIRYVR